MDAVGAKTSASCRGEIERLPFSLPGPGIFVFFPRQNNGDDNKGQSFVSLCELEMFCSPSSSHSVGGLVSVPFCSV